MKLSTLILSFLSVYSLSAQVDLDFSLEWSGYSNPTDISFAHDGERRIFITEQPGRIKIIDSTGTKLVDPFLDISAQVNSGGGEQGLLGMTFHPDFRDNGYFYVHYIEADDSSRISRFNVSDSNSDSADENSEKILLTIYQPFSNHNAGDLNFGPDGHLYIGFGDGGSGGDPDCRSQDSTEILGKMLRIDVNESIDVAPYYGIPDDNPYLDYPNVPDEIWAFGLRNPWRFSFDLLKGDLWIADVGQGVWEEVNMVESDSEGGENYGWKVMEGPACFNSNNCDPNIPSCNSVEFTDPIFSYDHFGIDGGQSITGGYVYRGCRFPELYGLYICLDYVSGNAWLVDSTGNDTIYINALSNVSTFGEDEDGELYCAQRNGNIFKIVDNTMEVDCECVVNRDVLGTISTGEYNAQIRLFSDALVLSGGNVTFEAGNHIELGAGFEVEDSAVFIAQIMGCTLFQGEGNTRINSRFYTNNKKKLVRDRRE